MQDANVTAKVQTPVVNVSDLMTLGQAARLVPTTNGKTVSTTSLWRWCSKGVNGCKLKHYRFGKRICVTAADLLDFGRQVAEAREVEENEEVKVQYHRQPRKRSAAQRERDIAAAEKSLRERGIMK